MLKQNPYYTYQIDAIESWLDEQAQKGLILDDHFGTFFSFLKGEPKKLRYRIDLKNGINYTEDQERIAVYREMGWEYVCELSSHADIYVCHDPAAPELNTDEGTLHEVLDALLKKEIGVGIVGTIVVPLLWFNNLWPSQKGFYGVYDSIVNGLSPLFAIFAILLILALTIPYALQLWDAIQTRHRLLLRRNYHTDSRARRRRALNISLLVTPILILLLVGALWVYEESDIDITAEEFGPSITVLFPGHQPASFKPYSDGIPDEMFWKESMPLNRAVHGRQWGHEPLDSNDAFDMRQTWTYNADMEHVHIQWLAEKYAAEQAEVQGLDPVAFPDWENAWFGENTDTHEGRSVFAQQLVLQNGKDVWSFSYWTYDEAPQYDLLSAVEAYWRANPTAHTG